MNRSTRTVNPRRLGGLLLAGTAAGLTFIPQAGSAQAFNAGESLTVSRPVVLAPAEEGEAGEGAKPAATAQASEGGEGGEAGAVADVDPAVADLARIHIVEGHLVAAKELYALGLADEAVALSSHPEAEMMEEVRATLAQWKADDFTPVMEQFTAKMADGVDMADVEAGLAAAQAAFDQAADKGGSDPRRRADALLVLLKAAASEYKDIAEGGSVEDLYGYHEVHGFLAVAARLAKREAAGTGAEAAAFAKLGPILDTAAPTFAHLGATEDGFPAGDPSLLFGLAARAEIALLKIR